MNKKTFLKRVVDTRDHEILCSDCLDQLNAYVDLEYEGVEAEKAMPQLHHHLEQCSVCREEYTLLRQLVEDDRDRSPDHFDDPSAS